MRIYVLTLSEVFDTGLATLLDTFSTANGLANSAGTPSTRFDVTIIGVRTRVRTSQGLAVPVQSATELTPPDVALVPAIGAKLPDTLRVALEQRETSEAHSALLPCSFLQFSVPSLFSPRITSDNPLFTKKPLIYNRSFFYFNFWQTYICQDNGHVKSSLLAIFSPL